MDDEFEDLWDEAAHWDAVKKLKEEIERLRAALDVIAQCPPDAVHLMPLAAQAALHREPK